MRGELPKGREEEPPSTRSGQTWRDISQKGKPKPMSEQGRRRGFWAGVKFCFYLGVFGAAVWAGLELYWQWEKNPRRMAAPSRETPISDLSLTTDGVLDREWVWETLGLPRGTGLMDVDLEELQKRLKAGGQVEEATVARKFPATLKVGLRERFPVARAAVREDGVVKVVLAARDGTLFEGRGYDEMALGRLPFLDGVRVVKGKEGFYEKIAGMEMVADLLGTAQARASALYRGMRVVSLARLAEDGVLVVKMDQAEEVVFGRHEDFFRQLARLDYLIEMTRKEVPPKRIKKADLSVSGSQVPVVLEEAPVVNDTGSTRRISPIRQQ